MTGHDDGIVRVPTDPSHPDYDATVEKIAEVMSDAYHDDGETLEVDRAVARAVLAALRGEP